GHVRRGFETAVQILHGLNMTVYDPFQKDEKAEFGPTSQSYNFLGCIIGPGTIAPGRASVKKLKDTTKELVDSSLRTMRRQSKSGGRMSYDRTLTGTLKKVNDILRSWGNQYSFCNLRDQFNNVDTFVNGEIGRLLGGYNSIRGSNADLSRRILGVHLMADSNYDPIL
ncbi:hypothetical protein ACFL4Y_04250, partial [Gemmatimonadota bacterium]